MNLRQTILLIVLALLPVAGASAQDDKELYKAEVCNEGRMTVDVAVAYKDFGLIDEFWIIEYWWHVPAGQCKVVFSHFYAPNNWLSFRSFPLHVAFAFTDSTGVWGTAKVRPPDRIAASNVQLCVGKEDYKYRVNGKDPRHANCEHDQLLPASIDWEPTHGYSYQDVIGYYGPPMRFTVALGPNDRAIPFGGRGSSTPNGKSADQGLAEIQFNWGVKYANGEGVPKDDVQAASWLRKAAEQGHQKAQFSLGMMYFEGKGVPVDWVQAYMWISLAAASDNEDAKAGRDLIKKLLTPAQIDEGARLALVQLLKETKGTGGQ